MKQCDSALHVFFFIINLLGCSKDAEVLYLEILINKF